MQVKDKKDYMLFGSEAQTALVKGATLMYQAVCTTLSPKGRNVAIQRPWGFPIVVHDGVTVSREVKDSDRFVQIGINLIKEAAAKTNDEAGDGTTTSTLIAYELITRGIRLKEQGVNPMVLRDELFTALEQAKNKLTTITKKVTAQSDLEQVATISSASSEIGKMVGQAVYDMGKDGLVTVEESGGYDTWVDKTDGMSMNRGYTSPYFVTDPYRLEATVNKPVIIVTDRTLTTNLEIVPIIEFCIKAGKKNIVIFGEVAAQALQTLVVNKTKGIINCLTIKPPGYGTNRVGFLEDIALLTGGKVISKELGLDMEEFMKTFDDSYLGHAEKVVADAKSSMIVGGKGDRLEIKKQVEGLRLKLGDNPLPADREAYTERIAKLTTGVAVVRVGAKTELEAREKMERVKDAVGAAQAALEEGMVAGSGVTFLHLSGAVTGYTEGAKLLREVLEQPMRKVMENCGEPHKVINNLVEKIRADKSLTLGYECVSGEVKELIKAGVVDPAKVIRLCLENGIGVASSVLTTEVLVDFIPPDKND
jgi:chaperonin GroEL